LAEINLPVTARWPSAFALRASGEAAQLQSSKTQPQYPPLPPPPPIDCAAMPTELAPEVERLPTLMTLTVLPAPPEPPWPPGARPPPEPRPAACAFTKNRKHQNHPVRVSERAGR